MSHLTDWLGGRRPSRLAAWLSHLSTWHHERKPPLPLSLHQKISKDLALRITTCLAVFVSTSTRRNAVGEHAL